MDKKIAPVIVIAAYNRPNALIRLLTSIDAASYPTAVKLFISLEGDASESVRKVANSFSSSTLQIKIIQRENRLGLRKHIIACGDLALIHGAVIVLEDDLIVDKYFYYYASEALSTYDKAASVAGIALYSIEFNEYENMPFKPMKNGYSSYPIQVPCSWGQCWSANQWRKFKSWYVTSDENTVTETIDLPDAVKSWPESSWKKYFAAYLVRNDLSFIYPYQAYSTNCSDAGGTHITNGTNIHQVAFASQNRKPPNFDFCPMENPEIAYDAFMEPCGDLIYRAIGLKSAEVDIDTLGVKTPAMLKKKYILTSRKVKKSYKQYPRSFRPVEQNFFHQLCQKTDECFSLALNRDCILNKKNPKSIAVYGYYCGVNMYSYSLIKAVIAVVPRFLFEKVLRKLLR